MRIVCVSDTHGAHQNVKVPEGDVFIFAGDASICSWEMYHNFDKWLKTIPCKHKIVVAGNHDSLPYENYLTNQRFRLENAHYLCHNIITIEDIKFFGSPFSKEYNGWFFMASEEHLQYKWKQIPEDTDVLITHGPAYGWLDQNVDGKHCGSKTLRTRLEEIKPKYHITGHIHEASAVLQTEHTTVINCSFLDENYKFKFQPKVFDFEK